MSDSNTRPTTPNETPLPSMEAFIRHGMVTTRPDEYAGDCSICQSALRDRPPAPSVIGVVGIHCGHHFHRQCLLAWFFGIAHNRNRCPNCRVELCRFNILSPWQQAQQRRDEALRDAELSGFNVPAYQWTIDRLEEHLQSELHGTNGFPCNWLRAADNTRRDFYLQYGAGVYVLPEHEQGGASWLNHMLCGVIRQRLLDRHEAFTPEVEELVVRYNALEEYLQKLAAVLEDENSTPPASDDVEEQDAEAEIPAAGRSEVPSPGPEHAEVPQQVEEAEVHGHIPSEVPVPENVEVSQQEDIPYLNDEFNYRLDQVLNGAGQNNELGDQPDDAFATGQWNLPSHSMLPDFDHRPSLPGTDELLSSVPSSPSLGDTQQPRRGSDRRQNKRRRRRRQNAQNSTNCPSPMFIYNINGNVGGEFNFHPSTPGA